MLAMSAGNSNASCGCYKTHEVTATNDHADLPLVFYVRESNMVHFSITYREIAPFNSGTWLQVITVDPDGHEVFSGIIDSFEFHRDLVRATPYPKGGIRHFSFSIHKSFLKNSRIVISSEWLARKYGFIYQLPEDTKLSFEFNLQDLYDWNVPYGGMTALDQNDKRLVHLLKRKGVSIKQWNMEHENKQNQRTHSITGSAGSD